MNLSGKVAIVTGGATGLGLATAKALVERGAKVVIAQRRLEPGLAAVGRPGLENAIAVQLDIRDREAVFGSIHELSKKLGRIDILVNNASVTGAPALASFLESSIELVDSVVDTNLKGTIFCSQAVAQHMIQHNVKGCIIHVSSVGAYAAQENASVYCATKAAQVMLTKSMALELATYGIRVNCVVPGDILTETSLDVVDSIKASGASGRFLRETPMGRRGTPGEVAQAIAFLASEDASYITGATLSIDGGMLTY
jgi:NAD(P)-dependent dehydrogenase (short-subunit alcohol dehydrogenase family)